MCPKILKLVPKMLYSIQFVLQCLCIPIILILLYKQHALCVYVYSGNAALHDQICVPIEGTCDSGSVPGFIINGDWILWPAPGNTNYRVMYSQVSETYSFCLNNATKDIALTEYCYQQHTAGCSICSDDSNQLNFLSHSNIFIQVPSKSVDLY